MNVRPSLALFGGTFDPVHNGHLRSALEIREALGVDELRMMVSHQPPLRDAPGASSAQRVAMVKAALDGEVGISVDERELRRDGPSYTVDTLREIRAERGPALSLTLVVGSDAYNQLHRWADWPALFELANLLVLQRPDCPLAPSPELAARAEQARVERPDALRSLSAGGFYPLSLAQLAISATDIRRRLAADQSIRFLVPDSVARYIAAHQLYRQPQHRNTGSNGS